MKNVLKLTTLIIIVLFNYESVKSQGMFARIDSVRKELSAAIVANDTAKIFSVYTDDAISMPNYSKMAEGLDAIRKSYQEMAGKENKITTYGTTTLKMILCGNIITEIGSYRIAMQMKGQPQPMEDIGKYLTIWEKMKDNSLKIKIEIWNTDKFPMPDSTMMK